MDNEKLVRSWQASIILECENRLRRKLTEIEELFITARAGLIALEIIEDTVKSIDGDELEEFLNSESNQNGTSGSE
jgi:hypothetical protein